MKDNFQITLIIAFVVAAVFGVFVFSGVIPIGSQDEETGGQGTVVLWGTANAPTMAPLIESFNNANPTFVVRYEQKSADTFSQDLLEALASDVGPDMFFLPDNLALSYKNKIFTIPYQSYPISSFKDNFAGAGEVFATDEGILAFPLSIDPIVMYYNRSTLDANGIVYPPKTWDELVALVPVLTQKDSTGKLIASTVPLGQFMNISHAKEIISMLFMQMGNPIVREQAGAFFPTLEDTTGSNLSSVLSFYTDFSDSLKSTYSWNRSLPNSTDSFSAQKSTFYFGFASELKSLVSRNPNQNFLIAPVPQIKGSNTKLTSARVNGIAISASSQNFNTAFVAASQMAVGSFASDYARAFGVAPARRDLLAEAPEDAYSPIFYSSALYARSWLDPSPKDTDDIFRGMVEKVLANIMTAADAITDANSKLGLLLHK